MALFPHSNHVDVNRCWLSGKWRTTDKLNETILQYVLRFPATDFRLALLVIIDSKLALFNKNYAHHQLHLQIPKISLQHVEASINQLCFYRVSQFRDHRQDHSMIPWCQGAIGFSCFATRFTWLWALLRFCLDGPLSCRRILRGDTCDLGMVWYGTVLFGI